ncbi:MAG TPA: RyR domain-containing protein [Luteolibacter sp.]|nr:RyR domain-containing protein [Luteolibacter sp.]
MILSELQALHDLPFFELIKRSREVHETNWPEAEVQLCTLLSIKTGGCSEDCSYCAQSARYNSGVQIERLMEKEQIMERARAARETGSTRFCMGAAWRGVRGGTQRFEQVLDIIKDVSTLGMEVCVTLGELGPEEAVRLREAGVTVVDKLGAKAADAFLRSHPGFSKTCDLTIHQLDCQDSDFLNLSFLEGLSPGERCSIIFCIEDETLVVSTILMMLDVCQDPAKDVDGIYLRTIRPDGPGDLLHRRQASLAKNIPIVPFASESEIWNEDVVLSLSLDLMAERIHETYRRGVAKLPPEPGNPAPAANKTWLALSPDERDGNRESADHLWAKFRTLGYELETSPIGKPVPSSTLSKEFESRIEEFASSEHYRWMAWRLINGWTYGEERDNSAKKHPDLVSYDDLTEAGREKDRMLVRILPELIEHGRLKARRLPAG